MKRQKQNGKRTMRRLLVPALMLTVAASVGRAMMPVGEGLALRSGEAVSARAVADGETKDGKKSVEIPTGDQRNGAKTAGDPTAEFDTGSTVNEENGGTAVENGNENTEKPDTGSGMETDGKEKPDTGDGIGEKNDTGDGENGKVDPFRCFRVTVWPGTDEEADPVGGGVEDDGAVLHTVVKGDTMWRLAVRYQVGLSEIIAANPQIKNPALIYPGDVLVIPLTDGEITEFEAEVIRLCNLERQKVGLAPLSANWELSRVARYKSADMRDKGYFSHQSPTYGSPFDMMKNFGIRYRTAGENIAMGYKTPAALVAGWMNSPGHRANILNAAFKEIGVGFVKDGAYATQMFIG